MTITWFFFNFLISAISKFSIIILRRWLINYLQKFKQINQKNLSTVDSLYTYILFNWSNTSTPTNISNSNKLMYNRFWRLVCNTCWVILIRYLFNGPESSQAWVFPIVSNVVNYLIIIIFISSAVNFQVIWDNGKY